MKTTGKHTFETVATTNKNELCFRHVLSLINDIESKLKQPKMINLFDFKLPCFVQSSKQGHFNMKT